MQVLVENEEGKHVAMSPTLFYLPHCDGGLCGNLLQANAGSLGSIAILGNSFRSYYDQWTWKDDAAKQQRCETAGVLHLAHSQDAGGLIVHHHAEGSVICTPAELRPFMQLQQSLNTNNTMVCSNEDWGWGPIVDLVEHKGVIEKTVSDRDFAATSTSRPFNDTSLHLFLKPLQRSQGSDEQARAGGAL